MSELKVIDLGNIRESIEKDESVYYEYYAKSEADKVIAEKDKEIQRLENLCESYRIDCDNIAIREANAYKEIERVDKKLRHQKYKRCLAMAKICEDKLGTVVKPGWWNKWHKRWLELAEKFKEAK